MKDDERISKETALNPGDVRLDDLGAQDFPGTAGGDDLLPGGAGILCSICPGSPKNLKISYGLPDTIKLLE